MSKQVYLRHKIIYVYKSFWDWWAVIILCIDHLELKTESMWNNVVFNNSPFV